MTPLGLGVGFYKLAGEDGYRPRYSLKGDGVGDAMNIDDHPNGTLNWMPMPRGYKPEERV